MGRLGNGILIGMILLVGAWEVNASGDATRGGPTWRPLDDAQKSLVDSLGLVLKGDLLEHHIAIHLFTDFLCEYCADLEDRLAVRNRDNAIVISRHFGSFLTRESRVRAQIAICLGYYDGRNDVSEDLLYKRRSTLRDAKSRVSAALGMTREELEIYLDSTRVAQRLENDQSLARRLGTRGTPWLFSTSGFTAGAPASLGGLLSALRDAASGLELAPRSGQLWTRDSSCGCVPLFVVEGR